jgi:outer membrane protein with beta-barrel domain
VQGEDIVRKGLAVCLLLMACNLVAAAQEYSKMEVFGGFQYTHADLFNIQGANLLGWNAQGTAYLNKPFGITAEVTGVYGSPTVGGVGTSLPTYTYMFGPTMRAPLAKATPFVHALFGAAHMSNTKGVYSSTGFALALGGGIDMNVSKSMALRVVQMDYLTTKLQDPTGTGNGRQNNFRLATGIVFRF